MHKHEKEDMEYMRDLVITRMDTLFAKNLINEEEHNQATDNIQQIGTFNDEERRIFENQIRREQEYVFILLIP